MPASRPITLLIPSAILLAVPIFVSSSAFAVVPDIKNFCIRYAGHAASETAVMQTRGCAIGGPPTWSTDNNVHMQWCLSQFGDQPSPQREVDAEKAANALEAARIAAIQQCQAQAPAPAPAQTGGGGGVGSTMNVVSQVTMYDTFEDGNVDKCYLDVGDTVKLLAPDPGAAAPWLHVRGTSGQCSGKAGYVYNDGKLQ